MLDVLSEILAVSNRVKVVTFILLGLYFLILQLFIAPLFKPWLQAKLSHADVEFAELIGMLLRKSDFKMIIQSRISAIQSGIDLSTRQLESHFLAGGDVPNVVRALIAAKSANIELPFETVAAADLQGDDVLLAVKESVSETLKEMESEKGI